MTIFLPYRPDGFYKALFLICAELISALFLFLRYHGGGKCRDKIVSKNAGRIFLPFRLHTILSAFAVLFNSGGRPLFREAHFDILRVLSQSEKLLITLRPCLLCSGLNARCLKYRHIIVRRQSGVQVENAARKLLAAQSLNQMGAVTLISNGIMVLLSTNLTTCAMQITDLQMVHNEQ